MTPSAVKTIPLQLEGYAAKNSATLRSEFHPTAGAAKGPGFSVNFEILYEVHGSFEPQDTDNASLLVVRVIPFPNDDERQFLKFSFTFGVQIAATKKQQSHSNDDASDYDSFAQFCSIEPASDGCQFVDIYTTNETRERAAKLSAQVPIAHGVSLGGEASGTNKSEFKRTHLLQVSSRKGVDDPTLPSNVYNRVGWTIRPANKNQGIGDSFTVALLVQRPPGSQFQLTVEVDGDVGSIFANSKDFLSSGLGGKKHKTILETFPLSSYSPDQKVPPRVVVGNLRRAANDNAMRDIEEIGLHLPEQASPVKFRKEALSATSFELDSIGKKSPDNDASAGQTAEKVPSSTINQAHTEKTPVSVEAEIPCADTTPGNHQDQGHQAPTVGLSTTEETIINLLAGITQQLQLMADGSNKLPIRASETSMVRVRRHREMAALFERLGELYREEAKEFLPSGEITYASGFSGQQDG